MTVILLIASAGNTCGHQVSLNVMPTGKEISLKHVFFYNKNYHLLGVRTDNILSQGR